MTEMERPDIDAHNASQRLTALEKEMVRAILSDRKYDRRWRNVRVFLIAFLLILYAILIFTPSKSSLIDEDTSNPYVSLVRLNGVIMPETAFSAERVIPLLTQAFEDSDSKGVIIVINSPGGSPVQASIIHDRILQLKKKYNKKVIVEGEDSLASGAYLISTAADKIFVHKDTLTGSIGVILSSFGFTDAMEKLGISRRVYTAGVNKDRLDPFRPETEADKAKILQMLENVHQNFIDVVRAGRGNRLQGDPAELFSGDFWDGTTATKLGLVDGTANLWEIMNQEFKVDHYRSYAEKPSLLQNIFKEVGTVMHFKLESETPALKAELNVN